MSRSVSKALVLAVTLCGLLPKPAAGGLACGAFSIEALPLPTPRRDAYGIARWQAIKTAVASRPHPIVFLGDSLTDWWNPEIWQRHYAARGALNGGVGGDRTEHLLWRLDNGNLAGPPPRVVVLLIGTNDLGVGRSPQITAEGIRRILVVLRARLPRTKILLLGLWPRGRSPDGRYRRPIAAVNRLIRGCTDSTITYLDLGPLLLAPDGQLPPAVAPDQVHLSADGYQLIAPRLDAALDRLVAAPD